MIGFTIEGLQSPKDARASRALGIRSHRPRRVNTRLW